MNDRIGISEYLKRPTKPLLVTNYPGLYPDTYPFDLFDSDVLMVEQGGGLISLDQTPIKSNFILGCSMLILKNMKDQRVSVFHIDVEQPSLSDKQIDIFSDFMSPYLSSLNFDDQNHGLANSLKTLKDTRDANLKVITKLTQGIIQRNEFRGGFIYGTDSRRHRELVEPLLLKPFHVPVRNDILAMTGARHWDMVYAPAQERIFVNARLNKQVFEYQF